MAAADLIELTDPRGRPRLRAVYAAHADWLVQTLGRMGIPERDRDDLAHDAFVIVHRRLAEYDPSRPLKPWLFGIAFRVASQYRRRSHNRLEVLHGSGAYAVPGSVGPDGQASARRRLALVAAALDRLGDTRRAVFIMHELDGFSIPEIAAVIDAPPNTLYSHLRRARKEFRAAAVEVGLCTEQDDD